MEVGNHEVGQVTAKYKNNFQSKMASECHKTWLNLWPSYMIIQMGDDFQQGGSLYRPECMYSWLAIDCMAAYLNNLSTHITS